MAGKTPTGRKGLRGQSTRASSPEPTTDEDETKGRVRFQIGGDSTPFVDDEVPLVASPGDSPVEVGKTERSQTVSIPSDHEVRQVFVELFELHLPEPGVKGEAEWEETARWIRYEEDVEGADQRWGRPHVAFLTFHSLLQLRYCILKGAMMLGATADSYAEICQQIVTAMSKEFGIDENRAKIIRNALQQKHKHATEPRHLFSLRGSMISPGSMRGDHSHTAPAMTPKEGALRTPKSEAVIRRDDSSSSVRSSRKSFLRLSGDTTSAELVRKLPSGAEAAEVFVAKLTELRKVRFCMVRLDRGITLPELLDAPIPVRFLFIIVGPPLPDVDYHEIGRSVATLMSNPAFQEIAYTAQTRNGLLSAVDRFLDESLVIPPGEIEKKSLLSVDAIKKALRRRAQNRAESVQEEQAKRTPAGARMVAVVHKPKHYDPLQRTGRLFAGVVNDVKHRFPQYGSDFKDALHFQCVTSLVFMFFASFAPAISFGGLLGEKIDNWMGPSEVLVAQCLCGVVWGLLSCQPVVIMAATGPVIVFEESLYTFCRSYGLEFMVLRVWAGFWIFVLAILTVCFEGSFLVRYISRFTEDIFSTLISMIFCFESMKFMIHNFKTHPIKKLDLYCSDADSPWWVNSTSDNMWDETTWNNGSNRTISVGPELTNQPDTALLSAVFLAATFALAFSLRQLRTSVFLGRKLRRALGDFGVPIALGVVVLFDGLVFKEAYVETLKMPDTFSTTDPSKRGWFIHPLGMEKPMPWWAMLAAVVPAILVFILIFVEVEITELLLASKERGLRKGSGFHYDLILVGVLTVVCSLMGLPWMCAAAVQSLAHAASLTIMKKKAPGERPEVDTVLEQRITTVGVSLLTGACNFLGAYLRHIPLAVLFGIFLYLGLISMIGVEFLNRVALMFMPQKYHPDVPYCKKVRMWRMHLFTLMQVVCLIILWVVKSIKMIALAFPFLIMLLAVMRKFLLPRLFTLVELTALDGHEENETDKEDIDEASRSRDFYQEALLPV